MTTSRGTVRGVAAHGVDAFLGVPFARADRFGAPQPAPPWEGLRDADTAGPAPYQSPPLYAELGADVGEDCLQLDIWRPSHIDAPLPVLVWIYGGGFEHGASSVVGTSGRPYAATGRVVVVSLNYRLGPFGWAQLAHLGEPFESSSNLGLRDQIAALSWVREEIAAFGGDPGRVTLLGESAGGFSIAGLLAAPAAEGLFGAAAMFSGCASRVMPAPRARLIADEFVTRTGVADPAALLSAPPGMVDAAMQDVITQEISQRNGIRPRALAVVDDAGVPGGVLSGHPMRVVESGTTRGIRMLLSSTTDEIGAFRVAQPELFENADRVSLVDEVVAWGVGDAQAVALVDRQLARAGSAAVAREQLLTDWIYRLPAARMALAQAAAGGEAHLLLFGRVDDEPATHGSDMPSIMGNGLPDEGPAASERRRLTSSAILDLADGTGLDWEPVAAGAAHARLAGEGDDPRGVYEDVVEHWSGVDRP
ncbi:MAG: hypothetical protein BGO94_01820 [Micrococcales bacterium 72-143]|nr:MAG: hypothetical protein BGO94_01820 [Micrococcales bacterium 72-143]